MNIIKNNEITAEQYKKIFFKEIKEVDVIYTLDGKDKIKVDSEVQWVQCYDKNIKARKSMPKFYFISKNGDLVALNPSGKGGIHLIRKVNNNGYWVYGISDGNGRTRTIYLHQLVVVIFGGKFFGNAKKLLEEQGLEAFGKIPGKLQVHHIDGDKTNNDPSNLRILLCEIHRLIEKSLPQDILNSDKRVEYFEKMCRELEKSEVTEQMLVLTGQKYDKNTCEYLGDNKFRDIETVEKISFSKEGMESLSCMLEKLNWSSVLKVNAKSKPSDQEVDKCQ